MVEFFRKLGQWLRDIQQWSTVDRGMVPMGMLVIALIQHLNWWRYAQTLPAPESLVHLQTLQTHIRTEWGFLLLASGLLALGFALRKRMPEAEWYQHLTANAYGLILCWGGYNAGALNFASGVVLMGAPMVGFILLNRGVVKIAFAIALATMLGLSFGSAFGLLPYSPVSVAPFGTDAKVFWTVSLLSFALPHLLPNTFLVALMIYHWRRREAAVLELSLTDALTRVHNRRSILSLLDKELARTRRYGPPLAILLLDLDHFKKINDQHGHPVGDHVLQKAAQALASSIRGCDAIGRFGGEEFLIILPDTLTEGALTLAERCRENLQALMVDNGKGQAIPITASFGVVCNEADLLLDSASILHYADEALYLAKQSGRNRCVRAEVPIREHYHATQPSVSEFGNTQLEELQQRHPELNGWQRSARQGWRWILSKRGWQQQFANVLEWSIAERTVLVMGIHVLMLLWIGLWLLTIPLFPDAGTVIHAEMLTALAPWWIVCFVFSALLGAYGLHLSHLEKDCRFYHWFSLHYFGLSLVGFGYLIGVLNMSSGVLITCTPMLGLILFRSALVWSVNGLSLLAIIGLAMLSAYGKIPYAPLLSPGSDSVYHVSTPFWVYSCYLISIPTMLVTFVFAEQILGRWRERESRIQSLCMTDELTQLHNRRSIMELVEKEIARTLRHGPPLAVVLIDLDHFKNINDTWGHPVGDQVLKAASRVLKSAVRASDVVGRYGGEEFMLLLPDTTLAGAKILMERCRLELEQTKVYCDDGEEVPISGSIGIASNELCFELSLASLIHAADDALYAAKHGGRNQVRFLSPTGEPDMNAGQRHTE